MAHLVLFRHGKARQAERNMSDFDRPLSAHGEDEAASMGRVLAERGLMPDRVLCSAALRTRQTLKCALPLLREGIAFRQDLYRVDESGYLGVVQAHGQQAKTLMVVGHNPVIQETALQLVAKDADPLIDALNRGFPTAGLAVIEFDTNAWEKIRPGAGQLRAFLVPG